MDNMTVGEVVVKYTGDYSWVGVICSVFRTPAGQERFVVAHRANLGFVLHIYSRANLREATSAERDQFLSR
jgi:hypothetical protein